jgi:hypothetical protein
MSQIFVFGGPFRHDHASCADTTPRQSKNLKRKIAANYSQVSMSDQDQDDHDMQQVRQDKKSIQKYYDPQSDVGELIADLSKMGRAQKGQVMQIAQNHPKLTRKEQDLLRNLSDWCFDKEKNAVLLSAIMEDWSHVLKKSADPVHAKQGELFLQVNRVVSDENTISEFTSRPSPLVTAIGKLITGKEQKDVQPTASVVGSLPAARKRGRPPSSLSGSSESSLFGAGDEDYDDSDFEVTADRADGKRKTRRNKRQKTQETPEAKETRLAQEAEQVKKRFVICKALRVRFSVEQIFAPLSVLDASELENEKIQFSIVLDKDNSPDLDKCKTFAVSCDRNVKDVWPATTEARIVSVPKKLIEIQTQDRKAMLALGFGHTVGNVYLHVEPSDPDVLAPVISLPLELPTEPKQLLFVSSYSVRSPCVICVCFRLTSNFIR